MMIWLSKTQAQYTPSDAYQKVRERYKNKNVQCEKCVNFYRVTLFVRNRD